MTVDRIVHLMAGLMVLLSIALAHFTNNPAWLWLTAFVGANLAQSGVTGFCPL
ncbi:MAG: YgaP family membrane protein, partial [Thiobacillus sp.]